MAELEKLSEVEDAALLDQFYCLAESTSNDDRDRAIEAAEHLSERFVPVDFSRIPVQNRCGIIGPFLRNAEYPLSFEAYRPCFQWPGSKDVWGESDGSEIRLRKTLYYFAESRFCLERFPFEELEEFLKAVLESLAPYGETDPGFGRISGDGALWPRATGQAELKAIERLESLVDLIGDANPARALFMFDHILSNYGQIAFSHTMDEVEDWFEYPENTRLLGILIRKAEALSRLTGREAAHREVLATLSGNPRMRWEGHDIFEMLNRCEESIRAAGASVAARVPQSALDAKYQRWAAIQEERALGKVKFARGMPLDVLIAPGEEAGPVASYRIP